MRLPEHTNHTGLFSTLGCTVCLATTSWGIRFKKIMMSLGKQFPMENVHCLSHPLLKIPPTFPNIMPRPYDRNIPKQIHPMFCCHSTCGTTINHVSAIIYENKNKKILVLWVQFDPHSIQRVGIYFGGSFRSLNISQTLF